MIKNINQNFLNIDEKDRDKPIFRVISIKRLFELFTEKKNVLVKPTLWDDPFENFIMNSSGELEGGQMFSIGFRDHFFGQCWTKTRESDAMWRIYSPDKNGVRIASTPRKLLHSHYDTADKYKDINCFVGGVNYYTSPKLKTLLDTHASTWIKDSTGAGQAQTLLFKRSAFKHENEIRLVFNSQGKEKSDFYRYPIDSFDLIDDVVFDPRIDYKEFARYKTDLKKIGFEGRIVKSILYQAPKLNFKIKVD